MTNSTMLLAGHQDEANSAFDWGDILLTSDALHRDVSEGIFQASASNLESSLTHRLRWFIPNASQRTQRSIQKRKIALQFSLNRWKSNHPHHPCVEPAISPNSILFRIRMNELCRMIRRILTRNGPVLTSNECENLRHSSCENRMVGERSARWNNTQNRRGIGKLS